MSFQGKDVYFKLMDQTNSKNEFLLEIETLSYGPYGIGRLQGRVIMIPITAPGDKVRARISNAKENYAVGEVAALLRPSSQRRPPPCKYFSRCGGCSWQHLRYEAQLQAKQKSVEDALRRIGKLSGFELRAIVPSPREFNYRRRIRLQADRDKRLGFYRAFSHELVEIESCLIADEQADLQIVSLRQWASQLATPLVQLEIICGDDPGELVIVADSNEEFNMLDETLCESLLTAQPPPSGVIFAGPKWRKTWGQSKISLHAEGRLRLLVEADVFTQVNPAGNREVVKALAAAGEFNRSDRVLELYSGAGNFTLPLAERAGEIVAVEAHRPSIESGKHNARLNGLDNIRWIHAQVPAAVRNLSRRDERFTKVVLDPPRAGAKGIERDLASLRPERIMYISCNPTTLARDLSALAKQGCKLTVVQPFDLFPQTFHVETLAVLTRA